MHTLRCLLTLQALGRTYVENTSPGLGRRRGRNMIHPNELVTEGFGERINISWTLAATPVPFLVLAWNAMHQNLCLQ